MSKLRNPVLILAWALPLIAVVASFISLALAIRHSDPEVARQETPQLIRAGTPGR